MKWGVVGVEHRKAPRISGLDSTTSAWYPHFDKSCGTNQKQTPHFREICLFMVFARSIDMDLELLQYEKQMRALGNYRRLVIIQRLKQTERMCVLTVADELGVSFQTASKHLGRLFQVGILVRKQVRNEMHYKLSPEIPASTRSVIDCL